MQAVERALRKYQAERKIFQVRSNSLSVETIPETKELLEVKRVQIRAGRANEAVLVKRLAERLQRDLDRQGFFYIHFCLFLYLF